MVFPSVGSRRAYRAGGLLVTLPEWGQLVQDDSVALDLDAAPAKLTDERLYAPNGDQVCGCHG